MPFPRLSRTPPIEVFDEALPGQEAATDRRAERPASPRVRRPAVAQSWALGIGVAVAGVAVVAGVQRQAAVGPVPSPPVAAQLAAPEASPAEAVAWARPPRRSTVRKRRVAEHDNARQERGARRAPSAASERRARPQAGGSGRRSASSPAPTGSSRPAPPPAPSPPPSASPPPAAPASASAGPGEFF